MNQPPAKQLSVSSGDWVLLFALSLLWGGAFSVTKIAVVEIPPPTLALGRVAIAALILGVIVWINGQRMSHPWSSYSIQGLFQNAIPFTLIFWGQLYIESAYASILIATAPLFTVLVAHIATDDDKLTPARSVGLAAGFVGVVILIGPSVLRDFGTHVAAEIACLLAALSYACGGVYGRRFRNEAPIVVSTGQLIASSLMLIPIVALVDQPWTLPVPSANAWISLGVLAVLSTALAYLIFFRVLARAGATNVMLVSFLMPVTAILIGVLLLDEELAMRHVIGMAAIAIGLAAIDGRIWLWVRRKVSA